MREKYTSPSERDIIHEWSLGIHMKLGYTPLYRKEPIDHQNYQWRLLNSQIGPNNLQQGFKLFADYLNIYRGSLCNREVTAYFIFFSYGDRQTITSLLRKLKQQSRDQIKNRKLEMINSLKALGDFVVDLKWDFTSWVPLVSKMLPSDVCKITKKGFIFDVMQYFHLSLRYSGSGLACCIFCPAFGYCKFQTLVKITFFFFGTFCKILM